MGDQNAPQCCGRLVVVSNRLPFALKRDGGTWAVQRSAGGLAAAMDPLLRQSGGIWIGWPGDSSDPNDPQRQRVLDEQARQGLHVVELSQELVRGFYEGFSNETLWPLFHQFPTRLHFTPEHWADYQQANRIFRDAVLRHLRPDDLVWVHDYQLMLLPQLLREAMPDARIGFFLHIPFPTSSMFRLLPRGDEVLAGLLGADYLAFHTHNDVQHFRNSVLRRLGLGSRMDAVDVGGRAVRLEALPISIDPKSFARLLHDDHDEASRDTRERMQSLRTRYAGRQLIVAIDRLDYTKGIPNRFRTFDRLLKDYPEFREKVVMIQVAVPSRENVATYAELGHETDELVGQVNGRWGTPDWTPLVYIRRGLPAAELAALYATADVAWVAPLRDGMNLVAKEFIACREGAGGVLVLSEFAGAAAELGEALQVNPYDEERTAEAVARGLTMGEGEQRQRMAAMYRRVLRHDVFAWGDRFVESLRAAAADRAGRSATRPPELNADELLAAYARARRRLLLLDYDGTLVGFAARPQDAVPTASLVDRLAALAADPANTVALVSGRSRDDLDRWFGRVPGLWLAAEHGAMLRSAATMAWEGSRSASDEWKPRVRAILDHFVDRTPGSFVEEKEFALVWHYRMVHPEFGEWIANELASTLEPALSETELVAQHGNKIVEVKLTWANKGEVLARVQREAAPDADFLFFVGDDRTDEDLFGRLPETAWSVHVGDGPSGARFRLSDPARVQELLGRLARGTR